MVVGSQCLNALYASKEAHQHQQRRQAQTLEAATYSEVDAAMSNPYDPMFGSMQTEGRCVCPCVAKRQSITRTSAIICTCNPSAPRQITISPSVSNANLSAASAQSFQYLRDHRFGMGSPAISPLSVGGGAAPAVVAASSSLSMGDTDMAMDSGGGDMMMGAEDATMIVDVPAGIAIKRSLGDDASSGHLNGDVESSRQTKRLRTDNMGPSAATILCTSAPASMIPAQRDELCRLLQQSSSVGSISYADVIQHFAQRGVWLDSEVTTWLLRVLGQN